MEMNSRRHRLISLKRKLEALQYKDILILLHTLHANKNPMTIGKKTIILDIAQYDEDTIEIISKYVSDVNNSRYVDDI